MANTSTASIVFFGISALVISAAAIVAMQPATPSAVQVPTAKAVPVVVVQATCSERKAQLVLDYNRLMSDKKFYDAAQTVRLCGQNLNDKELVRLTRAADAADLIAALDKEPEASAKSLKADYTDILSKQPEAKAKVEKILSDIRKQDLKAKAEKKKLGVAVGMSKDDVLASSWGRPNSINRTTGTWGVHEQWVYGGHNYLFFENGVLTTIMN